MIRDALAAGQSITLERRNVKRTKHLTVKGVLLNGKVMTETSEWSDPGDAIVKIDRVECDGRPLKKKKAEVQTCIAGGSFTVHGYIKRPANGLKFMMCSVQ